MTGMMTLTTTWDRHHLLRLPSIEWHTNQAEHHPRNLSITTIQATIEVARGHLSQSSRPTAVTRHLRR